MLNGSVAYSHAPTQILPSPLLPPAERRRTGVPVKIALTVAQEACVNAGRDPAEIATVFTSSGGDGDNVHEILQTLASTQREVSPTRFHNSVHNAAAGYWSIATQSREPSTSLCGHDASFAAGLLDAATQVVTHSRVTALVAYDHPYPQPFHSKRPLGDAFAVALILAPHSASDSLGKLDIEFCAAPAAASRMSDTPLEALRTNVPAARSLPLLAALAGNESREIVLEYGAGALRVMVSAC
jgi:Beta-ketoacyl synthase, N-terminal domain